MYLIAVGGGGRKTNLKGVLKASQTTIHNHYCSISAGQFSLFSWLNIFYINDNTNPFQTHK